MKRYLKEQGKQARQEILAQDEEFLRALQAQAEEKPEQKRRSRLKIWLPAALSSVAAAAVLVTCIAVYYPFGEKHVEYLDFNFEHLNSTLEELNKDMKEIDLQIDPSLYTYSVVKTSDSVSNDVLYYTTTIDNEDMLFHMEIVTVCNPNFKYKNFKFADATTSATLDSYTVTYETSIEADDEFGFETLSAKAEIHKGKEFVYVTDYSELLTSPDGSFLEILQSIVK